VKWKSAATDFAKTPPSSPNPAEQIRDYLLHVKSLPLGQRTAPALAFIKLAGVSIRSFLREFLTYEATIPALVALNVTLALRLTITDTSTGFEWSELPQGFCVDSTFGNPPAVPFVITHPSAFFEVDDDDLVLTTSDLSLFYNGASIPPYLTLTPPFLHQF